MQLGKKIRDLRLRRGMTVQQLAEASDLSKGFISQVENDRTSPSLATLQDLARALETSVAYLVVEEEPLPFVVRAAERQRVRLGGNTSRVEVLSASPKRNLELLLAELPPGLSAGDKRHYHHGEECLLCLEGRVSLAFGREHAGARGRRLVPLRRPRAARGRERGRHRGARADRDDARRLRAAGPGARRPRPREPARLPGDRIADLSAPSRFASGGRRTPPAALFVPPP